MSSDTYASTSEVVERATTDTAFELLKSGRGVVFNGRRDAVWRARRDGVIEVARAQWGRVELYEVQDETARLAAKSDRSARKVAANICAVGVGCSLVGGVLGAIFVADGFAAFFALMIVLFPVALVLRWRSDVRPWIRGRFGSDEDWADVPWTIEGTPTTGNQVVALAALTRGGRLPYRVLDDGVLEVVVHRNKQVEVLALDHLGVATITETFPSKRFELADLRGAAVTWHEVHGLDPSD